MAATPSYASTPRFGRATISTADASLTSPSSVGAVLTAVAAGTLIERVLVQATGTTTQGVVRLFVYDGTNYSLIKEVEVYAVIPSSTVPAFAVQLDMDGIVLPNGHGLRATTSKSESFVVTAFGSDLT